MRPAEIGAQDIIETGKTIQADGKRVTGYALRRLLGGGDQKRLFSVWQNHLNQETNQHQEATIELPVELEEALNELSTAFSDQIRAMGMKLHDVAVKSASRHVAQITREYKELEEQTDAELKDATVIIEELEKKNLELEESLQKATQARDKALENAEKDREKAISMEARMKEMAGIEDIMNRLKALEEKPEQS